jgi:WD40 repeat protein/tRNA A-37 threonylcarbamoyl transferase component Bud32
MTGATDDAPADGGPSSGTDPDRPMLALLMAYQRRAWRRGERTPVEAFLAQQPALREDAEAVLDLIYQEVILREQAGEAPRLEEYLGRFPHLAPQLALQFELEGAFGPSTVEQSIADVTLGKRNSPAPAILPTVPGYEVMGVLGRGGMGVVYKVRQLRLNRVSALKMILAGDHAEPEAALRFLSEAEAVAKLNHPHIVQVFTCGDHDGRPYIEMECVDGGSLADRLDGTPWPAAAAPLIETVARAIQEAHRLGIVHRDLKPANVLLTADGTPKVADFGLAKWLGVETGLTRSSWIVGSPSYMAPEQADGKAGTVGPAADVYSLGAVLYELLTGRPPFKAATVLETLEQVKSAEPVSPIRLQPKLPRDLVTICLKCLEKEPARRYATAAELAEDLRRFGAGEVIRARPIGAARRGWRWCRRRPSLAALGAAVVLLLAIVAVGAPMAVLSLRHERDLARAAEKRAVDRLRDTYVIGARATRLSGREGQRFDSLKLLEQAARIRPSAEVRDQVIACLAAADLRVEREWEGFPVLNTGLDFDYPLTRYARSDWRGTVSFRRVADDSEIRSLPAPEPSGPATVLRFDPEGRYLAALHVAWDPLRICHRVWDLADGRLVLDLPTDDPGASVAFSPDGRRLAAGREGRAIGIYELATGREVARLEGVPDLSLIAFHPLGRLLAASSWADRAVEVRNLETGAITSTLRHPVGVHGLAWSPDGATLAAGCGDHHIYLWDAVTSRLRAVLKGHNALVTHLTFHPSDDLLISGGWDDTIRLWQPSTGELLVTAPGSPVRLGPDGRRLAYRDDRHVGIREVADGEACRLVGPQRAAGPDPEVNAPGFKWVDFDPGGRLLVAAGGDGVHLWDLPTWREVAHLPLPEGGAVLFDPRGGGLITYATTGLQLWPIRPGAAGSSTPLRLGPPRLIMSPFSRPDYFFGSLSAAGGWLAAGDRPGHRAIVLDLDRPKECRSIPDRPEIESVALSPDGHWLAAGGRDVPGVRIRERETGRLVATLPGGMAGAPNVRLAFSPDGRLLIVGFQGDYRAWSVGDWRLLWTIERSRVYGAPGPVSCAGDGRLAAIAPFHDVVELVDATDGRALAALESPDPKAISSLCFAPDGTRLAVATDGRAVQVWDLGAIRRHLKSMRLDWDLPRLPLSGAGADSPIVPPVRIGWTRSSRP